MCGPPTHESSRSETRSKQTVSLSLSLLPLNKLLLYDEEKEEEEEEKSFSSSLYLLLKCTHFLVRTVRGHISCRDENIHKYEKKKLFRLRTLYKSGCPLSFLYTHIYTYPWRVKFQTAMHIYILTTEKNFTNRETTSSARL